MERGRKSELTARRNEIKEKRLASQPLNHPSAGSVFKNPDGVSVAKLIEESGLKGYAIGGAMISVKHSNFIVNAGLARSKDVLMLIDRVKDIIKQNYNIQLETEIIYIN